MPGAKYMCADVKKFYLNMPMDCPEFMCIPVALIPQEIIDEYHLQEKVHDGFVVIQINKGMCGLPQAGILANKLIAHQLAKQGYFQMPRMPGFWMHAWRPLLFTLVVDDFGIKYIGKEHANHLLTILHNDYNVSPDWNGALYCGITLKWDYEASTLDISMPNYVKAPLVKFQHPMPKCAQHSPHKCNPPQYGIKVQLPEPVDHSAHLPPAAVKCIQQIIGTLLYYTRAVNSTMLVVLSAIALEQSKATEQTNAAADHLLDYCATNPDATMHYVASDMQLKIHSNASYLNESKACSRVGGHFFLGNKPGCCQWSHSKPNGYT